VSVFVFKVSVLVWIRPGLGSRRIAEDFDDSGGRNGSRSHDVVQLLKGEVVPVSMAIAKTVLYEDSLNAITCGIHGCGIN
jgi:hypothetical protein